ncbi:MAG: hypothetical protein QM811_03595 [Pirellulales bacterium]
MPPVNLTPFVASAATDSRVSAKYARCISNLHIPGIGLSHSSLTAGFFFDSSQVAMSVNRVDPNEEKDFYRFEMQGSRWVVLRNDDNHVVCYCAHADQAKKLSISLNRDYLRNADSHRKSRMNATDKMR